jgi:hypothetical protein
MINKNRFNQLCMLGLGIGTLVFSNLQVAKAGPFEISITDWGTIPDDSANPNGVRAGFTELFQGLEDSVNSNEILTNINPDTYLKAVANSTVTAGGGTDADYASPFSFGLIGANVGLAADLAPAAKLSDLFDKTRIKSSVEGVGAQAGILLGINGAHLLKTKIGFIDLSRAKGFLSFFAFGYDVGGFTTSFTHFAITGQYKLMQEKSLGFGLLKWGGVDLTGGLKYNKTSISLSSTLDPVATQSSIGGIGDVTATIRPTVTLGADVGVFSIPLEVSTYARVLYFLTFFGGAGMDFAFGSASSVSSAVGDIDLTTSVSNSGVTLPTAAATMDLGSSQKPSITSLRAFGGVQFELYALSITAQINKSITNKSFGATVGAKLFF